MRLRVNAPEGGAGTRRLGGAAGGGCDPASQAAMEARGSVVCASAAEAARVCQGVRISWSQSEKPRALWPHRRQKRQACACWRAQVVNPVTHGHPRGA